MEFGGDRRKPSPVADRLLMRAKDVIIIGTASIALVKWFYLNPIQVQDRVTRQEQILIKQQETMEKIAEKLGDIEKRFGEFQRSFYSKRPGGWVFEDDRWKWSPNEKVK